MYNVQLKRAKPKVIITMDGGIIQDITADVDLDVLIMDFDTDGADPEDLSSIGGKPFYKIHWGANTVDPELVKFVRTKLGLE